MSRVSVVFVLCALWMACEGSPRIPVSQLSLSPGCYTPFVAGSCTEVTSSTTSLALCETARQANSDREASLSTSLRPFIAIVDTMRAAPDQQEWVTSDPVGEGTILISADEPRLDAGAFRIEFVGHAQSEVVYATYTPNAVAIDLRQSVLRWNRNALQLNAVFRGCDPVRRISWDARYADDGVYETLCWDSSGLTSCDQADLWPR